MLRDYPILCLAAAAAGAVNSIAGGGTLLTFPALFAFLTATTGSEATASVLANGTSTVALFPGSVAGIWGYRHEVAQSRRWLWLLTGPSLLGGLFGSLLVILLPPEMFADLVPWLILTAAMLFALQPTIAGWFGVGQPHCRRRPPVPSLVVAGFQFLIGIYGGYFGAGIGILMLSSLAMMGLADIHIMNGLKTVLASCINGVAAAVFIVGGKVDWPAAIAMAIAAMLGGYCGARVARSHWDLRAPGWSSRSVSVWQATTFIGDLRAESSARLSLSPSGAAGVRATSARSSP